MCRSRKGVPGSKRSGEQGTPFLGPGAEPNLGSERAAGWSLGWSLYRRTPKRPPGKAIGHVPHSAKVAGRFETCKLAALGLDAKAKAERIRPDDPGLRTWPPRNVRRDPER